MRTKKTKATAKTKKRPAAKKTQGAKSGSKKDPMKKTVKIKAKRRKKAETTHIIAIIDKSGSMHSIAKDAIGGFNNFLSEQKKLKDKATMNVVLFSNHDKITPLYDDKILDIKDIQELTSETYKAEGATALNDAIVQSMTSYKLKENAMKPSKRADKVLVIIVTDGEENDSKEYPKGKIDEVKKLITKRKEENWQFIFLCSTEETALTGEALGVSKGNVFQFTNDSLGNATMYSKMSFATASLRTMSLQDKGYVTASNNLLGGEETEADATSKVVPDVDVDNDNDLA